ncbi:hypothetical protein Tco_0177850 [Tanacetum coccineum]
MRVSTNAPPSSSTSLSSNFEFQQMAAALEDKMTLTFRNEMNEMKNMMKALSYPLPIKSGEERGIPGTLLLVWLLTQDHRALLNPIPKLLDLTKDTMGTKAQAYQAPVAQVPGLLTSMDPKPTQKLKMSYIDQFTKELNHASTSGTLPSNTIPNPRNECKGITTRSGIVLDGPLPPMPPPYVNPDNEKAKETEVTKDKVQPESSQIPQTFKPSVRPLGKPTKTLPYPSRVEYEKKGENDKVQIQKFWEMFKKINVNITLADALILMPKYQKMLKNLLSNKEKLNEMANTPVSENCSAIILKKLPEKLEDPEQFLIPWTY